MKNHVVTQSLTACLGAGVLCAQQVADQRSRLVVQPVEVRSTDGSPSLLVSDTSVLVLRYDLSALQLEPPLKGTIWWKGKASGPGSNPSLALWALNEQGEKTVRVCEVTIKPDTDGPIPFEVSEYLRENPKDSALSFLIEMRSPPGFSQTVEFSGQAPLSIIEETPRNYQISELLAPLWRGNRMVNETILPTSYDGEPATANLAFIPSKIISVKNYALDRAFTEGKDFTFEGRALRLTPGSAIPSLNHSDLYHDNPEAKPGAMRTVDGGYLTFSETAFFNDKQLAVTYEHGEPWNGPVPQSAARQLPKTFAKLEAGEPLKLVVFGDSISAGASASGAVGRAPWMPRWADLVADELERRTGSAIDYINPSLGGMTAEWGRQTVDGLVSHEKPDLVILGFGMNDASEHVRSSTEQFKANTQAMIDAIRRENPRVEFILLMSFQPNEKWRDLEPMKDYLAALRSMEGEGIAVADVWSLHGYLLQHKTYWDMTGNHVNHPNDFLMRLYAQVVLAALGLPES
jgi:lysophospholipase L1-like esterase